MLNVNSYIIDQLFIPAAVLFFFIGGMVAVVIAIGLILRSPRVFRLFELMNRYVSSRSATKALAIPRDSGSFMWKHWRPVGMVFVVGSAYSLWGLLTGPDNNQIVSMLKLGYPPEFVLWIVETLKYFLIAGCMASIIVGILMLFYPDTLKAVESLSARWYSTRRIKPEADKMVMLLDDWVASFPRTAGLLIVFPGLVTTIYFGRLLFA